MAGIDFTESAVLHGTVCMTVHGRHLHRTLCQAGRIPGLIATTYPRFSKALIKEWSLNHTGILIVMWKFPRIRGPSKDPK